MALEAFLAKRRSGPERFVDLSLAVVKLIGRGEYAIDLPGASPDISASPFGTTDTHGAEPAISDLITQRLIKVALSGRPPYPIPRLVELAEHCTAREDDATKVERRVAKSAAALLLSGRTGETFDAVVTGASAKGTWVRITSPPVEGRLERGTAGLDVGDPVRVTLISTDVERGFIDFARD